jgi:hypothetical protein
MQTLTPSVSSPSSSSAWDILSRFLSYFRTASLAERPAMRWAEMKPIDFQGEDTSLTQEQLDVLR